MTDLSPAAKAILEAYDNSPWEYDTADFTACAAVIRAVADQVVPSTALYARSCCEFVGEQCRAQLLAIADELEAQ